MKKCPFCEAEILESAVKCIQCGEWLKNFHPNPDRTILKEKHISAATDEFFSLSIMKLICLSVFSLGLYHIYWFYRHWKALKQIYGEKILPWWRGFLNWVYCFQLFDRVSQSARQQGYKMPVAPEVLALIYVVLSLVFFITAKPWRLIWILSLVPLIFVQQTANFVNSKVNALYKENNRFVLGEIAVLILGGAFTFFFVVGTFIQK